MNLSTRAKVLLALGLTIGLVLWVVVIDFGSNAGRSHYGVNVRGVDGGGLTFEEAQELLQERGEERRFAPVVFSAEGMNCDFIPDDVGWGPEAKSTTDDARSVGFEGGVLKALGDRLTAYFSGVTIDWAGEPKRKKVSEIIDDCEEQAQALGLEIDRNKMRRKIARAIVTWPRPIFQVPIES